MINQIIAVLESLSELLNEVSGMINDVQVAPVPFEIIKADVEILFDNEPETESGVSLPRYANVLSILPMRTYFAQSPSKYLNHRLCPQLNQLDVAINIEDT